MTRRVFRILMVVALVVATVATSCSREETDHLKVPSKSILVPMPGASGTTSFDSSNITSIVPTSVPKGWSVDKIDMYASTITVTAPTSFDDEEVESGKLTLTAYTPTGNTTAVSIFLAIVPDEVDYTSAPANCYVASLPATRYKFDPMRGGNGDIALATAKVKVLWQTSDELIKYLDMRDGSVTFYLEPVVDENDTSKATVEPGNAVIGAYDANDELIWSWHIWVTNNDPTVAENTIELGGQTLMNHNLGADTNSNGAKDPDAILRSYGLYYQWGRKEPMLGPNDWNFVQNYDDVIYNENGVNLTLGYVDSKEGGSVAWSTANPLNIILGNPDNAYDWLYDGHDDTLWSADTKSNYDPCPAGWHVPSSDIFASLTIAAADDAMAWEEAQPMYGWMLEDTTTGASHFFSAAGRRNYLDGRLDNMNVNETLPVPWSGYYWSATPLGDDASALYFNLNTDTRSTWNGIDTSRAMHRANALPVRCVKAK